MAPTHGNTTLLKGQIAQLVNAGLRHHQAGDLQRAEHIYRQVLELDPNNVDGLQLLGVISQQAGRLDIAAELIGRALAMQPDSPLLQINLGNVLKDQGKPEAAAECYRKVLDAEPGHIDANYNLGAVYQYQGKWEQAIQCYEKVIELDPGHVRSHYSLGVALHGLGETVAATQAYRKCIELAPDHAKAYHDLGCVLSEAGQLDAAVDCCERALALQPELAGPKTNLARMYNNLANAHRAKGELDQAVECYRRALALEVDLGAAHHNLGIVLRDQGKMAEAVESFERALQCDPSQVYMLEDLIFAYQEICHWDGREELLKKVLSLTDKGLAEGKRCPIGPFSALALPFSPARLQAIASNYACTVLGLDSLANDMLPSPGRARGERLRIGYVSSDFYDHATAHLMSSLFALHDRQEFEIFAYSFGPDDGSAYRRRIVRDCDHFVDISEESCIESAKRIARDGIHVLIDLKGYTKDIRPQIFAYRPAPIQVNYLGFPGTMGVDFIDYILTDQVVTPPDQQPFFNERFVYLPHSYQVNDHQQPIPEETPSRSDCGLPKGSFVFCCFNNNYKIEPAVFDVWMRILSQVPDSVLWLLRSSPLAEINLRKEAAARGIVGERLVFAVRQPKAQHLARHRLADLFLDTHYCNAHTTASDALWAGLPLLTCPGQTFASRVSASLLTAVGLPELIAVSLEAYETLALHLATHPDELHRIREKLEANRLTQPLFDTPRFARALEQAYRAMWSLYESGEQPRQIAIQDPQS